MLTLASRANRESYAFYGCRRCGTVARHRFGCKSVRCSGCGTLLECDGEAARWFNRPHCPHCNSNHEPMRLTALSWQTVLVQRLCMNQGHKHFDLPTASERSNSKAKLPLAGSLGNSIPDGLETSRLIRSGFRRWCDLYPRRQLQVLLSGSEILKELSIPENVRDRLTLCLVGAAEMAGHLCRWDRFHPKVFEALANHRYAFDGFAVEPNPMCSIGRGSLERRIRTSTVAAQWLRDKVHRKVVKYSADASNSRRPVKESAQIFIAQGSSGKQLLPENSVSLVITDPPYFDSVQYGELSAIFTTWIGRVARQRKIGTFHPSEEAVPNRIQGRDARQYQTLLTSILKECARTMRSRGRLVLTYHSTNLRAWACLGDALAKTGFKIVGLAVVKTENGQDHSKRGTRAFVTDLVIECSKLKQKVALRVPTQPKCPEERELLHVGRAIAEAGGKGYPHIREEFLRRASKMRSRRIESPAVALSSKQRGH